MMPAGIKTYLPVPWAWPRPAALHRISFIYCWQSHWKYKIMFISSGTFLNFTVSFKWTEQSVFPYIIMLIACKHRYLNDDRSTLPLTSNWSLTIDLRSAKLWWWALTTMLSAYIRYKQKLQDNSQRHAWVLQLCDEKHSRSHRGQEASIICRNQAETHLQEQGLTAS